MKKTALVILFLFHATICVLAQVDLRANFQIGHVWRSSATFDVGYRLRNHTLSAGVLFNTNPRPEHEYNNVFKRRFFGNTFKERLSVQFSYCYDFMGVNKGFSPFVFSSFTYSYAPVYNINFLPVAYFENGEPAYLRVKITSLPMSVYELYCGIGLRIGLFRNLYLIEQAAVGYNYFTKYQVTQGVLVHNTGEFGAKFRFGLGYTFGSASIFKTK